MRARARKRSRSVDLAIVGTDPFAVALREALSETPFPYNEVRLLASGSGEGSLAEFNGEPRIVLKAEEQALEGVQLAFFCEDPATGGAYRNWPSSGGYLAMDLTNAADITEKMPFTALGRQEELPEPRRGWIGGAHPLAHLVHTIVAPLAAHLEVTALRGVILRPASDFGKVGLEELYQQSVNLLNFSKLPRQVFGRQLAFNLMPTDVLQAAGVQSTLVSSQVRALMGSTDLPVSLFMAVAPVFHAHTVVMHLDIEDLPSEAKLRKLLGASNELTVGSGPLTSAELEERPRPHVGLIRNDPVGGGVWLWVLADRVEAAAAEGAVLMAARLLGFEPRKPGAVPE
ncbi:MAG: Asd/ArgC dimerization domain-containing protein [Acidobacteriota bacterium]